MRQSRASGGFTAVELMISLVVLSMIALATLGLTMAIATGWKATDSSQQSQITDRQVRARLINTLHTARYVGLCTADGQSVTSTQAAPAATAGSTAVAVNLATGNTASVGAVCFFWGAETVNTDVIDLCEIVLIEHDIGGKTLKLYQVPATAANAHVTFHPSNMDDSADVTSFKALPNVTSQVIAHDVTSVRFTSYYVNGSQVPRMVEFCIGIGSDAKRTEYGCVVLKSARSSTSGL